MSAARTAFVALAILAAIVALGGVTAIVGAQAEAAPENEPEVDPDELADGNVTGERLLEEFDPGGETRMTVGGEGATMVISVHYGFFSNLPEGGAFGITIQGNLDEEPVVSLRTAITFDGEERWGALTSDLWNRFGTAGHMHMDLPFLDAIEIDDVEPEIADVESEIDGQEQR